MGGKEGGGLFLPHNRTELGYGIANHETTHFLADTPRARGVYAEALNRFAYGYDMVCQDGILHTWDVTHTGCYTHRMLHT